jgi:hypothetical protein
MKPDNLHNQDADFFDYLADIEQSSVSDEDVLDLHKRIDKKVLGQKLKSNSNGLSVVLVIGFTTLLFFVLFNKKTVVQIGITTVPVQEKTGDILKDAILTDTTVSDVAAPLPLIVAKEPIAAKEHFIKESMDSHFAEEIRSDELETKKFSLIDTADNGKQLPDNYLQLLPNAPVIYIYDLKVTEFQTLYFKKMKPWVIDGKGISSEFENAEAYTASLNEWNGLNDYTLDMLLKDALKKFNKQRYKQGFVLFNDLMEYNKRDVNAWFYSALCQYYLGKYKDAIARLNKVLDDENNVFDQEAEWYKALCLVKNGDQQEGVELLLKINEQKGFYANNAGEKLKEITEKK